MELKGGKYKTKITVYRVEVSETSTFVVNFFSYVNENVFFFKLPLIGATDEKYSQNFTYPIENNC